MKSRSGLFGSVWTGAEKQSEQVLSGGKGRLLDDAGVGRGGGGRWWLGAEEKVMANWFVWKSE